jgi:hypothetical protein
LGTDGTNLGREDGIPRHFPDAQRAKIRTTSIQTDAIGHHLDIIFLQTGGGADFACPKASLAGFDAVLVFHHLGFLRSFELAGSQRGPFEEISSL